MREGRVKAMTLLCVLRRTLSLSGLQWPKSAWILVPERFRIRPPQAGGGGEDALTPARRRSVGGGVNVNVSGPAPGRT